MSFRQLLPYSIRRHLPVEPDPRDGEFAAVVLDDGRLDPEWVQANTRHNGFVTVLPDFPRITTPESIERTLQIQPDQTTRTRRYFERKRAYDSRRYPQTYARLLEVREEAQLHRERLAELRDAERQAGEQAGEAARQAFRAAHAAEYDALT